jgi:elongation factor 1-gamma
MEVAAAAAPKEGAGEQKKEKQKEPKQEKQEPKKEKQQPKKKEETAEEEPLDDEEKDKESKKKNPLDSLPPSKMVMDDWKRMYSNNDTKTVANPWFWENYDPEGYSIWLADYKYNQELEKTFMTCNLVNGFFQRVEKLRKYGFGSVVIFGDEPKLEIGSCWLFRGTEIPPEMQECDDAEHYTWRKADVKDEATKNLISSYWSWEGDFGGKKFNQGKIFK